MYLFKIRVYFRVLFVFQVFIEIWFIIYCIFCLQIGSSFLIIEIKEENFDVDNGDFNLDLDLVDEGVNKCDIFYYNKSVLYNGYILVWD